jgi:hypothetical protein
MVAIPDYLLTTFAAPLHAVHLEETGPSGAAVIPRGEVKSTPNPQTPKVMTLPHSNVLSAYLPQHKTIAATSPQAL